jgi:hypothetical protein
METDPTKNPDPGQPDPTDVEGGEVGGDVGGGEPPVESADPKPGEPAGGTD